MINCNAKKKNWATYKQRKGISKRYLLLFLKYVSRYDIHPHILVYNETAQISNEVYGLTSINISLKLSISRLIEKEIYTETCWLESGNTRATHL